jgi:hypothetical protein
MAAHRMALIFGNSPFEVSTVNLQGEAIIQRTSAGTEGIVEAATKAERLYAASYGRVRGDRQRPLVRLNRSARARKASASAKATDR